MPVPIKKDDKGNARPVFAGSADAADAKRVLCGWCEKEIPADAEQCPFCKKDPRTPGAMADLLDRAETIRETRKSDSEPEAAKKNRDPLGFLSNLVRH